MKTLCSLLLPLLLFIALSCSDDPSAAPISLTFDKNSPTATGTIPSVSVSSGELFSITNTGYVNPGYTFLGWATSASGPVVYSNLQTITIGNTDLMLYAVWDTDSYTITFDNNSGSAVGTMDPQTIDYGQAAAISNNSFTNIGYDFLGWATNAPGGVVYTNGQQITMGIGNITLYAVWRPFVFNFNNAGASGRQGPTQTQVNIAYSGTSLDGAVTATATGIQQWVVPRTGTYRIEAYGASGANAATYGRGARMRGTFTLTAGETVWILVGQQGSGTTAGYAQIGGGGGSFVSIGSYLSNSTLMIAAGGGGAVGHYAGSSTDGTTATSGNPGYSFGSNTVNNQGGTAGNPGGTGGDCFSEPEVSYGMDAAAGIHKTSGAGQSQSFFNGGLGSQVVSGTGNGDGGFGGGGARTSGSGYASSGGGGGYSGGGASDSNNGSPFAAGGGGSYNSGSDQSNSAGARLGHGLVTITFLD